MSSEARPSTTRPGDACCYDHHNVNGLPMGESVAHPLRLRGHTTKRVWVVVARRTPRQGKEERNTCHRGGDRQIGILVCFFFFLQKTVFFGLIWLVLCGFFVSSLATKCCNVHCMHTRIHLALLSKPNHPKKPIHVHWSFLKEEFTERPSHRQAFMASRSPPSWPRASAHGEPKFTTHCHCTASTGVGHPRPHPSPGGHSPASLSLTTQESCSYPAGSTSSPTYPHPSAPPTPPSPTPPPPFLSVYFFRWQADEGLHSGRNHGTIPMI